MCVCVIRNYMTIHYNKHKTGKIHKLMVNVAEMNALSDPLTVTENWTVAEKNFILNKRCPKTNVCTWCDGGKEKWRQHGSWEEKLRYISLILQFLRCVSAKSFLACWQTDSHFSFFIQCFSSSPHLHPPRHRRLSGPWRQGRLHLPPVRKVSV